MSTFEVLDAYAAAKREINRIASLEMRALDFGQKQMSILYFLSKSAASMKELAEYTLSDKAATTRTVESLQKSGLIKRTEHATDRRVTLIELTAKGRAKAAQAVKMRKVIAQKVNQALEDHDRKKLVELLNQLTQKLQTGRT